MKKLIAAAALAGALATAPAAEAITTYRTFPNCTELRKVQPRGIAKASIRVSPGSKDVWQRVAGVRKKYRPSVISTNRYNANRELDRDDDGVACEV